MKFCWRGWHHLGAFVISFFLSSFDLAFASKGSQDEEKELALGETDHPSKKDAEPLKAIRARQKEERKKRFKTVRPNMMDQKIFEAPDSDQGLVQAFGELKIGPDEKESEESLLIDFSKPIAPSHLLFDFGVLPQKLTKHIAKFGAYFRSKHRKIVKDFVVAAENFAHDNLLLRAENESLFHDLKQLPEDYAMLAALKKSPTIPAMNAYLTHVVFAHNTLSRGIAPRGSRFRNQGLALEVIQEEVWDYIQEGQENFSDTEKLGSKVIRLTIEMITPLHAFLERYKTLFGQWEMERKAFYHMLYLYGGVTKKTIQFEQAIECFPSYMDQLRLAANESERREQALEEETKTLLQTHDVVPNESEVTKGMSSPRRSNLTLDLSKIGQTRKKSSGQPSANNSQSRQPSPIPGHKLTSSAGEISHVTMVSARKTSTGKTPKNKENNQDDSNPAHVSEHDGAHTPKKYSIVSHLGFKKTDEK